MLGQLIASGVCLFLCFATVISAYLKARQTDWRGLRESVKERHVMAKYAANCAERRALGEVGTDG